MRILNYYPRALVGDGGMTGAIRRLSDALIGGGAQAAIAFDAGPEPPSDSEIEWIPVRHAGTKTQRVPVAGSLRGAFSGADLVVLNSAWTPHNVVAGRVARAAGIPYVVAPRGAYEAGILRRKRALKGLWWRAAERELVFGARAVHVFFPSERPGLARLGYHGDVLVAPNGVEPPAGIEWDGGSGGYILWLGRFDPEHKGLDLLLQALARLDSGRRPHLQLCGPDSRGGKERTRRLSERLGLERWVTIADPVYGREKWDTLTRASAFVYPSRWEGFGNSLAEAASIGLPCLGTPYPLARFLAERGAGLVAEATADSLADGLAALGDAGAVGDVGVKARALVAEELSWTRVAQAWRDQAAHLLGSPSGDGGVS